MVYNGGSNLTKTNFSQYYQGSEIVVAGEISDNDVETFTPQVLAISVRTRQWCLSAGILLTCCRLTELCATTEQPKSGVCWHKCHRGDRRHGVWRPNAANLGPSDRETAPGERVSDHSWQTSSKLRNFLLSWIVWAGKGSEVNGSVCFNANTCDIGCNCLALRRKTQRMRPWNCLYGTALWPRSRPWWSPSHRERTQMCLTNQKKVKYNIYMQTNRELFLTGFNFLRPGQRLRWHPSGMDVIVATYKLVIYL